MKKMALLSSWWTPLFVTQLSAFSLRSFPGAAERPNVFGEDGTLQFQEDYGGPHLKGIFVTMTASTSLFRACSVARWSDFGAKCRCLQVVVARERTRVSECATKKLKGLGLASQPASHRRKWLGSSDLQTHFAVFINSVLLPGEREL